MLLPAANSSLPDDFDWEAYLQYYPWLRRQGVATELAAADHYLRFGRAQVRSCCSASIVHSISTQ